MTYVTRRLEPDKMACGEQGNKLKDGSGERKFY